MSQEEPGFFCDVMLGRLAKWLRILGYSSIYQSFGSQPNKLLTCTRQNLVFLTRNSKTPQIYTKANIVFITSEIPVKQLVQLKEQGYIKADKSRLFRICTLCNEKLEKASKEAARGKVPPFVYSSCSEIMICKKCQKYFWRGTHHKNFIEQLFHRLT